MARNWENPNQSGRPYSSEERDNNKFNDYFGGDYQKLDQNRFDQNRFDQNRPDQSRTTSGRGTPSYPPSYSSSTDHKYDRGGDNYGSTANTSWNQMSRGDSYGDRTNFPNRYEQYQTPYQNSYSSPNQSRFGSDYTSDRSMNTMNSMNTMSHTGKGPKNWTRSDDRIKEDACEALERSHEVDASEIHVEVKEGIVTLSGHVENRPSKRAAEDCVHHLSGVRDVRNELTVDQSLFQQAKEAIFGDSDKPMNKTKPSKH